jgi:hypothetical protein
VKDQYRSSTPEDRRAILAALVDKVVLWPNDSYVSWREPFGMLFGMARVSGNKLKGE